MQNTQSSRIGGSREFFKVNINLAEMAVLASNVLPIAKKLPPVVLDLRQEIITGLVQYLDQILDLLVACPYIFGIPKLTNIVL